MTSKIGSAPFYCGAAGLATAAVSAISYSKSTLSSLPTLAITLTAKTSSIFAQRVFVLNPLVVTSILTAALSGWLLLTSAVMFTDHFVQDKDKGFASLIHKIHALIFGANAVLISALLFPFSVYSPFHGPYGKTEGTPILLLNGYLSYGSNWYFQAKELSKAEIGPIYTMNIGTFKSIQKYYAPLVATQVKKILKDRPIKEIILVCHSKGGLVGSYYAVKLAEKDDVHVKKVITLGTPFGGSLIADTIGVGQDAQEMVVDSAFTKKLRTKISQCTKTKFYQIFARYDIFTAADSAKLTNAVAQHTFNNLSHLGLIISLRPVEIIAKWIRDNSAAGI